MRELKKIVMIDDEKAIQMLAKMALEKVAGFEVIAFDSGPKAFPEVEACAPDLILLDVMMPEMDGPDVFRELRKIESLNDIPIFFLTGKSQDNEKKELMDLGADGIIAKPFDPMKLGSQIKELYEGLGK